MNAQQILSDRRRNNLIRELKSRFSDSKFEPVLIQKIDWLRSLGVKVLPVAARGVVVAEKINYGGKVTWEKGAFPKKPISLMLNMLDFTDVKFLAILLHECGHIKDKDNELIHLETVDSEISAWNHAIFDFRQLQPNESEKASFVKVMRDALLSYQLDRTIIEKMIIQI